MHDVLSDRTLFLRRASRVERRSRHVMYVAGVRKGQSLAALTHLASTPKACGRQGALRPAQRSHAAGTAAQ